MPAHVSKATPASPRRRARSTPDQPPVTRRPRRAAAGASRPSGTVLDIPLAALGESGRNPRRKLHAIDELAESLTAHGLLQPVVVRVRAPGKYELIAGHRRVAAARQLGWASIQAVVRSADEDNAYLLTLVENLQRSDLTPREEADALAVLIRQRGWTTRQVAAEIHRSQPFVSKRLRVFEDDMLAPAVLGDQLSLSSAEELLTVPDRYRYDLLARAVKGGWEHAEVRAAVRERRFESNRTGSRRPGMSRRVHDLRAELRDVRAEDLTAADRRELRQLLVELRMLAQASPKAGREPIFPPLPAAVAGRRSRA
jgi:ParB/RepB/Spo0J family partition protein